MAKANIQFGSVSVIIPVYNRANTILRALNSALNQSVPPLEVLVIDDFSSDETGVILETISNKCLRVIRLDKNQGAQRARLVGIREAQGEFLAFLDSDDQLLIDSIEKRLLALKSSGWSEALVYGDAIRNGKVDRFEVCNGNAYRYLLKELSLCPFSVMLIPKRCFDVAGVPDRDFPSWQDDDMVMTVGRHFPVLHCGAPVAVMHVDNGRISGNKRAVAEGCRMMVAKYAAEIRSVHGAFRMFCWRLRIRRSIVLAAWSETRKRLGKRMTVADLALILFLAAERVALRILLKPFFRNFYG
jgi:glycosyltransferase involved in cell wall biosynthesis